MAAKPDAGLDVKNGITEAIPERPRPPNANRIEEAMKPMEKG